MKPSHTQTQVLSIVIPCYNEEGVLRETNRRLLSLADRLEGMKAEIIYVDDGSRDATASIIRQLASEDGRVRGVLLARNFGHQRAVSAGIASASGDAVVLIDADLQDPPEVIHDMVGKWKEGFEVVYGTRTHREGESAFKLATARLFYRLLNRLSEVPIPLDTGDFRLMDRRVVDILAAMPEQDRFIRGMVAWVGFRQYSLPYARARRFAGTTKYPLRKMLRFAFDGILSFSSAPLRAATYMGLACAALAFAATLYAFYVRLFTSDWVGGWATMIIAVLFLGGVQLVCLGVLGEYVGRIYSQSKQRPLFVIGDRIGFDRGD